MDQENKRPPYQREQQGSSQNPNRRPPVRYDENGNPIPPRKRPPVRYDENGNPIPPSKRPPVRYDENGNPIPPRQRPPLPYDENGNPILPRKRPPVRYDENGNPIPPRKRPPAGQEMQRRDESRSARMTSGYDRYQENEDQFFDREAYLKEREEERAMRREKQKKKKNTFGKILIAVQALATVVFMVLIFILDLLPAKYVAAIAVILLILWGFTLLSQKLKAGRTVGKVYAVFIILVLSVGTAYIWKANNVMADLTTGQLVKVNDVSVVVLADSPAQSLQDLDGKRFGVQSILDRTNTNTTLSDLQSRYSQDIDTKEYDGFTTQAQALYNGEVDAIIINEAYRPLIHETYPKFNQETRVLDSFTYREEIVQKETKPDVNVTEEPFTVFISGNDSYGTVSLADGRTDVNILATVNPKTRQILLTTTPRDYYIELPFYDGCMDKLTHAGLYGVDCSMTTLENLYGIDIDYYVRVNFSGFQDIVDALGGVEVYSDYSFTASAGGYYFDAGYNYVDGASALAFVRERYAFSDGDVQRGRNQMAMIKAIIDKAMSPAILTNYMGLMDSLSGCFITDMPRDKISDLVKMQLGEGGSWNIVTNSVHGYGDMLPTYSGGSEALSVMKEDAEAVRQAKELIQRCENGEILSDPS